MWRCGQRLPTFLLAGVTTIILSGPARLFGVFHLVKPVAQTAYRQGFIAVSRLLKIVPAARRRLNFIIRPRDVFLLPRDIRKGVCCLTSGCELCRFALVQCDNDPCDPHALRIAGDGPLVFNDHGSHSHHRLRCTAVLRRGQPIRDQDRRRHKSRPHGRGRRSRQVSAR